MVAEARAGLKNPLGRSSQRPSPAEPSKALPEPRSGASSSLGEGEKRRGPPRPPPREGGTELASAHLAVADPAAGGPYLTTPQASWLRTSGTHRPAEAPRWHPHARLADHGGGHACAEVLDIGPDDRCFSVALLFHALRARERAQPSPAPVGATAILEAGAAPEADPVAEVVQVSSSRRCSLLRADLLRRAARRRLSRRHVSLGAAWRVRSARLCRRASTRFRRAFPASSSSTGSGPRQMDAHSTSRTFPAAAARSSSGTAVRRLPCQAHGRRAECGWGRTPGRQLWVSGVLGGDRVLVSHGGDGGKLPG